MEYTKRRNLNRGYMTLEVWHKGMDLDLEAKRANHDWRDRVQDKILAHEPGGAFGVQTPWCPYLVLFCSAYSAALGSARGAAVRCVSPLKKKAAGYAEQNTKRYRHLGVCTPNASRLSLQPNEEFSPGTWDGLPHSSMNPTIQQSNPP